MSYWANDWPNLNSISIALDGGTDWMSPADLGIVYRLVWFIASQSVNTQFSEPIADPFIREDRACNVARCSRKEWRAAMPAVSQFFNVERGEIRLKDHSCIRLSKEAVRSALPVGVRTSVLKRDGERCVYCGAQEGPFHFDHLWPHSRGGSDAASNIVIACAPCNLSKGGRTLIEWMATK